MTRTCLPDAAFTAFEPIARRVSRVAFGTSQVDDRGPSHREALALALEAGINLIDTASSYRNGHAERLVGQVLEETGARDVVVVTKAGYLSGSIRRDGLRREREGLPWRDVVVRDAERAHCISPDFLTDQLTASLSRLRRPRVDVLLLHNPELVFGEGPEEPDAFHEKVQRALAHLESEVAAGRIGAYGISSNRFAPGPGHEKTVDLTRLLALAGPGFRVIQLPMNAVELAAREKGPGGSSVLDVARSAGLHVLVNRPLGSSAGRLARVAPPFPVAGDADTGAWTRLLDLEAEFVGTWAPRLGFGASATEILAGHAALRRIERTVGDLDRLRAAWTREVAPYLDRVLPQLSSLFEGDEGFRAFAERYRFVFHAAAALAIAPALAGEERRVAELDRRVTAAFGSVPGATLSQRAVRGLAATPGVTSVLLGMRRARYVEDAVAAWL